MADIFGQTITGRCHILLAEYLRQGDTAVDCTCGNGNDTLFLCQSVGSGGKVYAFDIQECAIQNTKELLEAAGCEAELFLSSNTSLMEILKERIDLSETCPDSPDRSPGLDCGQLRTAPAVIMYNLGYLPGGDHGLTTRAEETIASLGQAVKLLKKGGVLSVTAYPGHEEGRHEAQAVRRYLEGLSSKNYEVITMIQTNRSPLAPVLHLLYKR